VAVPDITPEALLYHVASTTFYQPKPEDDRTALELWEKGLIQRVHQGKLHGYALTPAGYRQWLGHRQR